MADRLDQPLVAKRSLRPSVDQETVGRFAERLARFLGTGRFLVVQTLLIISWVVYNELVPSGAGFDAYPFIFLTLVLSLQAAYAAPLILLAQNRQTDRDRANLVEDRDQATRALEDTEYLVRELADVRLSLGDVVTRDFLREVLRELAEELQGGAAGDAAAKKAKKRKPRRVEEAHDPVPGLLTEPQQPDSRDPEDEPIAQG